MHQIEGFLHHLWGCRISPARLHIYHNLQHDLRPASESCWNRKGSCKPFGAELDRAHTLCLISGNSHRHRYGNASSIRSRKKIFSWKVAHREPDRPSSDRSPHSCRNRFAHGLRIERADRPIFSGQVRRRPSRNCGCDALCIRTLLRKLCTRGVSERGPQA